MPNNKNITYSGLPYYGMILNNNLLFPTTNLHGKKFKTVKNIINPVVYETKFGKIWYPTMHLDLNYNPYIGSYSNANGPLGPYFAHGLGNTPNGIYENMNYGNSKKMKKNTKVKKNK